MFREKEWNEKTELERFETLVDEFWELVFGTVRRPEKKFEGMMTQVKPKRARTKSGKYKADVKETKEKIGYEPKINLKDYIKEVISE